MVVTSRNNATQFFFSCSDFTSDYSNVSLVKTEICDLKLRGKILNNSVQFSYISLYQVLNIAVMLNIQTNALWYVHVHFTEQISHYSEKYQKSEKFKNDDQSAITDFSVILNFSEWVNSLN